MPEKTVRRPSARPPGQDAAGRLERARQFSIAAARLCADSRCRDVRVLEVAGISPVCDFFVLATAAGQRQMKTIVRDVSELSRQYDLRPMSGMHRVEPNERWHAIDLVDVMVHLFSEEARLFYDLDALWGDAIQVDWSRPADSATASAD